MIRAALQTLGLPGELFASHSFRIGAANAVSQRGYRGFGDTFRLWAGGQAIPSCGTSGLLVITSQPTPPPSRRLHQSRSLPSNSRIIGDTGLSIRVCPVCGAFYLTLQCLACAHVQDCLVVRCTSLFCYGTAATWHHCVFDVSMYYLIICTLSVSSS